jgi:hypothetical protein
VVSLAAAATFVLLPRRYALVLPALVGAYFVLTTAVVENGRHGIHQASLGKLWAGIRADHPNWIDRAVGSNASVAILRSGLTTDETVWENEFFNRSVGKVYSYAVERVPDPLPGTQLERRGDELLADGKQLTASYVLADGSVDLLGTAIAQDPGLGTTLYRVDGPLIDPVHIRGLYPDTWSGPRVVYRRTHCRGGRLSVTLGSDPSLYTRPQTVVARVDGRVVGRASIEPAGSAGLRVPLRAENGTCTVRFDVARTKVPGLGDRRALGAHFLSFAYLPFARSR